MIKIGPKAALSGPRALLLDCHERIRRFTGIALRLADEEPAANEVREAVEAVHRYFTIALPLHEADEELSLLPRLGSVADALADMVREHREADALLREELVPRWTRLIATPDDRALRLATADPAQRLSALMQRHLELEEQSIFPALDELTEEVCAAMVAEMRGRRG